MYWEVPDVYQYRHINTFPFYEVSGLHNDNAFALYCIEDQRIHVSNITSFLY